MKPAIQPRLGIYSGTFDPVHAGHIAFAQAALSQADLEQVVIMPEPNPRSHAELAPLQDRISMLQLAIAGIPNIAVLHPVSERFSIAETLPKLHELYPTHQLVLLLGSDVVASFTNRWPDLALLFAETPLVIGLRGQDSEQSVTKAMAAVSRQFGVTPHYQIVATAQPHITATTIRRGAYDNSQIDPHVSAYIAQHKLYY